MSKSIVRKLWRSINLDRRAGQLAQYAERSNTYLHCPCEKYEKPHVSLQTKSTNGSHKLFSCTDLKLLISSQFSLRLNCYEMFNMAIYVNIDKS